MTDINDVIAVANDYVWYVSFVLVIAFGIIFTLKLKGIQIRELPECVRNTFENVNEGREKRTLSSFEAFCVSMGARVGSGNIAGIAFAIVVGGPGAVFWMWVFAIIGCASAFIETILAQIYKEKKPDGGYHGGLAYYAEKGLGSRKLGIMMALLTIAMYCIGFSGIQACTITSAFQGATSFENNTLVIAVIISVIFALIIFGGQKRVGKFSTAVVPVMAVAWIVFSVILILVNYANIPSAFGMIFEYAFSAPALIGGGLGTVILTGMRRGIYSNEAGLGTMCNISGSADTTHPVKQAYMQMFGVLVDTLIVCTCTALVILTYGSFESILAFGFEDARLVQVIAADTLLGDAAPWVIFIFMFVFAFTSLVADYNVGETNLRYITDSQLAVKLLRVIVPIVVFCCCLVATSSMFAISDVIMGLVALCNIPIMFLLSKKAMEVYRDYKAQKDAGIAEPVFHRSTMSDPTGVTEWNDSE